MEDLELLEHTDTVNELLARYGVKFGIYKNNVFKEQLFPFDAIPRIIEKKEFDYLERGLKQRVVALNLFLKDIYSKKQIVKDGVVPEDFIFASSGYMVECEGVSPVKDIYSHISGIDLVKGKNNNWYILEDNLRVPSGASYPMIARGLCRRSSPDTFAGLKIEDNRNYANLLRRTMDNVNVGGHTVILTPGRYNAAYFEHSYLAEQTGAHLVNGSELTVKDDKLYFITADGKLERVGAVYRRISDEYLDPMNFNPQSLIGIPHIFDIFRKGNVALMNAPTYLPFYEEDRKYVLEHFDDLVLKDVAEAGGYGVVFGNTMIKEQKENFIELLKKEPRRFIAQEVIDFQDIDILEDGRRIPSKADLRAFVLMADEPLVWKSGLTGFSRNPDSIISNLNRAYDNAIVLRESIGSETLSFIQLAIYEMNKAKKSKSPVVELQKVNDNLLAFYGTVDDQIGMIPRVEKCGLKYDPQKLEMIKSLVAEEKIDYYRIVNVVVSKCNYTIKCIPKNSSRQKISQIAIDMSPKSHYSRGRDGLGNEQIYGLNEEDHSTFIFHITGSAVTGLSDYEEIADDSTTMIFKHPHGLNVAGEKIKTYFAKIKGEIGDEKDAYGKAVKIDADDCMINRGIMHGGGLHTQKVNVNVKEV